MPWQEDFSAPLKIFYSYSHADEQIRLELAKAIALMRRQGLIEDWHDRKIVPGADWAAEIDSHLDEADIIALLISSDFINSDYCFGKEMTRALARNNDGIAEVIPNIVRAVDLTGAPFAHLQYLPKNGIAIKKWPDVDSAYKDVAVGIRTAVDRIKHRRASEIQAATPAT